MSVDSKTGVFHVPAVDPEPLFPDIEKEILKWNIGDGLKDARSRLQRTSSRMFSTEQQRHHQHHQFASSIDTIRLNNASDQVVIQKFVALHLPTSLHEKQVTNFEVRRLMQRTRGKPAHFAGQQQQLFSGYDASSNNKNDNEDEDDEQEEAEQYDEIPHANKQQEEEKRDENSPFSNPNSVLYGMDSQLLHRKGLEVNQYIREAAKDRSQKIPLPDRNSVREEGGKSRSEKDIGQWYHRLGMDPPK